MQFVNSCPLCGATHSRDLFTARDPHYGIPGEYRIVRCGVCRLQFVNPMPSDQELASLYPNDYYAYRDAPMAGRWKLKAKKLLGYWQGTKEPVFDRPGRFLDIGCGSGDFVARMGEQGWDSHGVEINEQAALTGRTCGLQIRTGTVQDASMAAEHFDYVRASHSFEHLTRPHETLALINKLLKPMGRLLLAVPNVDSLPAWLFKRYWWHLCPPVHPFGYSVRTLSRLLEDHGFQVTRVVFNSDYVGLLGSLQIWLNRRNGRRSFDGPVFRNRVLRVVCGWIEKLCDVLRLGDMIEIQAQKARPSIHNQTPSDTTSEISTAA
jgi:SAM-dependent methyltransferase